MKISKKTVLNILLIALVLSFFVTPLGYHGKVLLNRMFAMRPEIVEEPEARKIAHYDWQLKDPQWNFFNFEQSKGKVVFVNFWASWRLPCAAELKGIEQLYDRFGDSVDFYIITDEEREPVQEFMLKNNFHFPLTYLIIGAPSPLEIPEPPASYIIDKKGYIRVKQLGIADWDNQKVFDLIEELIEAE